MPVVGLYVFFLKSNQAPKVHSILYFEYANFSMHFKLFLIPSSIISIMRNWRPLPQVIVFKIKCYCHEIPVRHHKVSMRPPVCNFSAEMWQGRDSRKLGYMGSVAPTSRICFLPYLPAFITNIDRFLACGPFLLMYIFVQYWLIVIMNVFVTFFSEIVTTSILSISAPAKS